MALKNSPYRLFLFPAVVLATVLILIFSNRLYELIYRRMSCLTPGHGDTMDILVEEAGRQFYLKNFNDRELHNGLPYMWGSDKAGEIQFDMRIPCQLQLDITVSSPFVKCQGLTVAVNGTQAARFNFVSSCTGSDLLCADNPHTFSLLLSTRQGKNIITLTFDQSSKVSDDSSDNRLFSAVILGFRLSSAPSFFDVAIRTIGQLLRMRPPAESLFGPAPGLQ